MNLSTPPPEKLSDLIDLAIADARRLDQSRYAPTWHKWHQPDPGDGKCMVCLAGTVIAGTLGCTRDTHIVITTSDMTKPGSTVIADKQWRNALWALDSAREGDWNSACRALLACRVLHGIHADDTLAEALDELPPPQRSEFESWKELAIHLDSLAGRANDLRKLGL